jgi:hypothetical protein
MKFSKSLASSFALSIAVAATSARADLVTNGGFESGDFTGWTLSGNDTPLELNNLYGVEGVDPVDGISPYSGTYQAFIADLDANATTLSQTISTTAGTEYTVSWYLAQDTPIVPPYSNTLSVSFGGTTLASLTGVPVEGYTHYSYPATATSSSSILSLTLGNDLGEFLLDEVSVVPVEVPEPAPWTLAVGCALMLFVPRRTRRTRIA